VDVLINDKAFAVTAHGDDKTVTAAGEVELSDSKDTVITIERARPAERGAVLDLDIQDVVLRPLP
jgi:hypothetical protein